MPLPRIAWCWPEIVAESAVVRAQLERIGAVIPYDGLPMDATQFDVIVPRLTHTIDAAFMSQHSSLRVIATPSTGTDHIDLRCARDRGIAVLSLRDDPEFLKQLQSTAELAWLLILSCVRRLPEAMPHALSGHWNANAVRGHELQGKTIGIVGLGRLGSMVASFAQAFRMRVLGTDVVARQIDGVRVVPLDELLAASDVVSIHVHLDPSTEKLIGRRELLRMKPGSVLVNTSRGAVIDEAALLEVLLTGHLSAAGLDVLTGERSDDFPSHPLLQYAKAHANLVLTPHIGGCTVEAQEKAFAQIVTAIHRYWTTHATVNA